MGRFSKLWGSAHARREAPRLELRYQLVDVSCCLRQWIVIMLWKRLIRDSINAKSNCGKQSRDLPPLEVGGKVRFRPNGEREWRKAEVMPRSYMLDEYGRTYRRNRRQIISIPSDSPIDCEQSLFSQSSLSSAGLERANWPRGKLEKGERERLLSRLLPSFPSAFARFARFPRSRFPRSRDHRKGLLAV